MEIKIIDIGYGWLSKSQKSGWIHIAAISDKLFDAIYINGTYVLNICKN